MTPPTSKIQKEDYDLSIYIFKEILNESHKPGGISYIKIPFNCWEVFQKKGRIKVRGKINNSVFRSNLIPKGKGIYILPINKALRSEAGVSIGDGINVEIELDDISCSEIIEEVIDFKNSKMDVITAITTRSSIRKFTNQEIDIETIDTVLNAGFCAPSAKNKRPWHFILVRKKNVLFEISNINSNHKMVQEAACCIIICGDKIVEGINEFLIEDCSAAIQNMLLAINGLGLGGVWCGIHTGGNVYKRIIEIIELPEKVIPIGMIAIGYPAEQKKGIYRFERSKVHYEKW